MDEIFKQLHQQLEEVERRVFLFLNTQEKYETLKKTNNKVEQCILAKSVFAYLNETKSERQLKNTFLTFSNNVEKVCQTLCDILDKTDFWGDGVFFDVINKLSEFENEKAKGEKMELMGRITQLESNHIAKMREFDELKRSRDQMTRRDGVECKMVKETNHMMIIEEPLKVDGNAINEKNTTDVAMEEDVRDVSLLDSDDEMKKTPIGNLSGDEIRQLELWSNKRINTVLFDSYKDDYSQGSPTFRMSVVGHKDILVVIEDTDGNKFGGFLYNEITGPDVWIQDKNSFAFSLFSNGRIDGQQKYKLMDKYSQYAFRCGSDIDKRHRLFYISGAIGIMKRGFEGDCCFYNKLENVVDNSFCSGNTFHPKRFVVFQCVDL
ncbi:hypothetical protein EIN_525870 [Entamoeba invadens IP1]|uniref:TLDc domain-containing protein n=1 Tax=Entamoeba invadens IP1 TaxID=370355 RepID=A0A0A1U5J7_ENTIV|nr:hypothetical protein EIN_525870 [Entamoeba invadens IP1]ELP89592.1 hypothetical protein EIN_525870 [Entamoeba invadens IP1]|eukprot:XP_004256363.1 hypothetical protein EIN_525870 [Entamoeba invadens IP1]